MDPGVAVRHRRAIQIERNFSVVVIYQELNNIFYLNVNHNQYKVLFIVH